jgi:hypothetical protein
MTSPHGRHYCRHKTQQENGTYLRKFILPTAVPCTKYILVKVGCFTFCHSVQSTSVPLSVSSQQRSISIHSPTADARYSHQLTLSLCSCHLQHDYKNHLVLALHAPICSGPVADLLWCCLNFHWLLTLELRHLVTISFSWSPLEELSKL